MEQRVPKTRERPGGSHNKHNWDAAAAKRRTNSPPLMLVTVAISLDGLDVKCEVGTVAVFDEAKDLGLKVGLVIAADTVGAERDREKRQISFATLRNM